MRTPWSRCTISTAGTIILMVLCLLVLASRSEAQAQCDNCSFEYPEGTNVTLVATPEPGSKFAGWGGDPECVAGQDPTYPWRTTVVMAQPINCTAQFILDTDVSVEFSSEPCIDPEEGDITDSQLVFMSSIDGELGTGNSFIVGMSPGIHQVLGQCCDSQGACWSEQRTVTISINQPPQVLSWDLPADGACIGDGCP